VKELQAEVNDVRIRKSLKLSHGPLSAEEQEEFRRQDEAASKVSKVAIDAHSVIKDDLHSVRSEIAVRCTGFVAGPLWSIIFTLPLHCTRRSCVKLRRRTSLGIQFVRALWRGEFPSSFAS